LPLFFGGNFFRLFLKSVCGLGGFVLFFLFLVILFVVFLFSFELSHDEGSDESTVDNIFVVVVFDIIDFEGAFFFLSFLGCSEVENEFDFAFLLGGYFSDLVVVDNVVVFESVDGTEVDIHTMPGDVFEFFGLDLVNKDFLFALLDNFLAELLSLFPYALFGLEVYGELVAIEALHLLMLVVFFEEGFELLADFGKFRDLHFFLLLDLVFVALPVLIFDDQFVVFGLGGGVDFLEVGHLELNLILAFDLPVAYFPHVK
jgi:hypothetical protein